MRFIGSNDRRYKQENSVYFVTPLCGRGGGRAGWPVSGALLEVHPKSRKGRFYAQTSGTTGRRTVGPRNNCLCRRQDDRHSVAWFETFAKEVSNLPEVVEFYRTRGETDYLLRVVVPDFAGYDSFYKKFVSVTNLSDVSSSFAMEQIKFTTALPVEAMSH